MTRTVVYVVWGDKIRPLLERSIDSVKKWHPEIEVVIKEGDPSLGLMNKPKILKDIIWSDDFFTGRREYLFLDADTVVLGSLDDAFHQSKKFGISCCIGECPWLRRYNTDIINFSDIIEYNTGVIFFSSYREIPSIRTVFARWDFYSNESLASKWLCGDQLQHLDKDDQWAFSNAVRLSEYNPHILPINYNFRPGFHTRFFTPLKIWHSSIPVPEGLEEYCNKHDGVKAPIQWCLLRNNEVSIYE